MRLLLDEMWSHEIAVQLRFRGHDVIAITDPEHKARYGRLDDEVVFERAQEDGRAVVTENVGDFERARIAFEHSGRKHHGVIYARAPQFNRNLGAGVIGPMVRALDRTAPRAPRARPSEPRGLPSSRLAKAAPLELYAALASENALENLRRAVERELDGGSTREQVVAQLEELRVDLRRVGRGDDEDVVLEVMDFVSDWCSAHMRL